MLIQVTNKFRGTFIGTVTSLHWHCFGYGGTVMTVLGCKTFDTCVDKVEVLEP